MTNWNPNDPNRTPYEGQEPSMGAPQQMPGRQRRAERMTETHPQHQQPNPPYQPPQQPQSSLGWQQGYQPRQTSGQAPPPGYGWSQSWQQGYQQQNPPMRQQQNWDWQQGGAYVPQGYQPQEVHQSPQNPQQLQGGIKPLFDVKRLLILVAVIAAVIVAACAIVAGTQQTSTANAQREYVSAYADRYCEGVYVDGIHLGGMTREEALNAVQHQAQSRADAFAINLVTDNGSGRMVQVGAVTASMLGMQVDVADALSSAWQQGHSGTTTAELAAEMDALKVSNYHTTTAQPSGDTSGVDDYLAAIAQAAYLAPVDAYIAEFNKSATNPFTIAPEVQGRMLNVDAALSQINDMVSRLESGTIVLTTLPIMPAVTADMLADTVKLRGMAYTVVSSTSTADRNKNLLRACELMNGTVIAPGRTFSFNGVVGKRTEKNGFFPAIEYAYGEQRMGYGGGVCQVSSTIYIAAVRAGMTIEKRSQHSQEVNYTTYGLDATVNYDGKVIDFVFRNNTAHNVYVIARVQRDPKINRSRDIVRIEIYGEALPTGLTYDLEAAVTQVLPAPTEPEIIIDKTGEVAVYIDEQVEVRKASDGCVVDSWRVTYQDGKEVERVHMYTDNYPAKAQQFKVGVSERPLEFPLE